jgi:hypothetical protein
VGLCGRAAEKAPFVGPHAQARDFVPAGGANDARALDPACRLSGDLSHVCPRLRLGRGHRRRGGEPHPDALAVERAVLALTPDALAPAAEEFCAALAFDIGTPVDAEGALDASLANEGNLVLAYGAWGVSDRAVVLCYLN